MSLVSVVIPCYNYGWVLSETLDSLLAQTYQDWECLIVDDGSTDNTSEVAQTYVARDSRFQYFYQQNKGVSAARNLALSQIKGEFIQFLDGDDLLAPDKILLQVDFLKKNLEVDITYGDARYFMHGNPQVLNRSFDMSDQSWMTPLRGKGLPIVELLIKRNLLVISAPLFRSALLKQVGYFLPTLRSMEDWEFWMRCAIAQAYFYYDERPETWSLIRVHPTSLTQQKTQMYATMAVVRKQLEKRLLAIGAYQAVAINRAELNGVLEVNAAYNMQHGTIGSGLKYFWQTAQATGRYSYYLRSAIYYWRNRNKA